MGGKPLKDHLEALDHYEAIRSASWHGWNTIYRKQRAQFAQAGDAAVRPGDCRTVCQPAPLRSHRNRTLQLPSPAEIPALMGDFAGWLATAPNIPGTAFTAHRRVVDIHPFNDHNGRTARLLMNLVLIRGGYPPVTVRPEDRLDHIRSLQPEQAGQAVESFNALLYKRLAATLDEYLSALQDAHTPKAKYDESGGSVPQPRRFPKACSKLGPAFRAFSGHRKSNGLNPDQST